MLLQTGQAAGAVPPAWRESSFPRPAAGWFPLPNSPRWAMSPRMFPGTPRPDAGCGLAGISVPRSSSRWPRFPRRGLRPGQSVPWPWFAWFSLLLPQLVPLAQKPAPHPSSAARAERGCFWREAILEFPQKALVLLPCAGRGGFQLDFHPQKGGRSALPTAGGQLGSGPPTPCPGAEALGFPCKAKSLASCSSCRRWVRALQPAFPAGWHPRKGVFFRDSQSGPIPPGPG